MKVMKNIKVEISSKRIEFSKKETKMMKVLNKRSLHNKRNITEIMMIVSQSLINKMSVYGDRKYNRVIKKKN